MGRRKDRPLLNSAIPFALSQGATVTVRAQQAYLTDAAAENATQISVSVQVVGDEAAVRLSVPCLPYEDYTWLGAVTLDEDFTFAQSSAHGSIFRGVDFGDTNLSGCSLDRCDLRGADLSNCTVDDSTTVGRAISTAARSFRAVWDPGAFRTPSTGPLT